MVHQKRRWLLKASSPNTNETCGVDAFRLHEHIFLSATLPATLTLLSPVALVCRSRSRLSLVFLATALFVLSPPLLQPLEVRIRHSDRRQQVLELGLEDAQLCLEPVGRALAPVLSVGFGIHEGTRENKNKKAIRNSDTRRPYLANSCSAWRVSVNTASRIAGEVQVS